MQPIQGTGLPESKQFDLYVRKGQGINGNATVDIEILDQSKKVCNSFLEVIDTSTKFEITHPPEAASLRVKWGPMSGECLVLAANSRSQSIAGT